MVISLGLLGCNRGGAPSAGIPDCGPLSKQLARTAGVTDDIVNAQMVIEGLCTRDLWPAETRQCLAGAKERIGVDGCIINGMQPAKVSHIQGRLEMLRTGGEAARKAGNFADLDAPGAVAERPAADCNVALRAALLVARVEMTLLKAAPKGDVETTVAFVTKAVCERDSWPIAVLTCIRDAASLANIDTCFAQLPKPLRVELGRQVHLAVGEVESAIAVGKQEAGSAWNGKLAAP